MDSLRYGREVRWLFQTAMLVFLVTIGFGMARGLGIIDFTDRNQVLTHLHSGTIGWITLGIVASVLWLYGGHEPRTSGDRFVTWTAVILVIGVPVYIAAWWSANLPFKAVSGVFLLLGIVLFVAWLVATALRIGYRNLTTPQLGALVGLVVLVVGSALGVTLQIQYATNTSVLPGDPIGAHAETQVSAYLILVAMSLAYLGLRGNDRTRRGTWMVWLFFGGGVIIALSLLAGSFQTAILYIPLDLAAFVLLITLVGRRIVAPGWVEAGSARHFAIAIPFTLVFFGIFIYIIGSFIAGVYASADEIPENLIAAAAHPGFVGGVTNILFGMLCDLNRDRRPVGPWADHVVFWGINLAVTAFTVAILVDATGLFAVITPVLGLSIFVGVVTHSLRLQARPATVEAPMATA